MKKKTTADKKRTASKLSSKPQSVKRTLGKATASKSNGAVSQAKWTFLTNHAHVLSIINIEPDLVLREIAARVGITERAVQRIVHELEEDGYLVRERIGRRNRYQVAHDLPLRHPLEAHRDIGDLLELIEPT